MKRNGIFERDGYRCVYCGEEFPADELTLDHVQPRVRGGDRSEGNLVTACRACNILKGHHRLSAFLHDHPPARANAHSGSAWRRSESFLRGKSPPTLLEIFGTL